MHELSMALAVVKQVEEAIGDDPGSRVTSLRLRVGELAGVTPEALRFSLELAARDTPLEGARLEIEPEAAIARCGGCGREQRLDVPPVMWCVECGQPLTEVLSGRELQIEQVLVHDPEVQP